MHQIRFRTPLGELTALPQIPYLDLGALLLRARGRKGKGGGEVREGKGREGRRGRGGEGKERKGV